MKTTLMITAAAFGLMLAGGAQAQVLGGGLGGNVGGSVGGGLSATRGNLGVRDTLGATRDLARETATSARDAARDARSSTADAALTGDSSGALSVDRNGAAADFSGSLGADVTSSGGESLGRVVGMAQDAASGARTVLVQGADGVVRGIQTTDVEITGDGSLSSDLTAYAFRRQPEQAAPAAAAAPGSDVQNADDNTRSSGEQSDDQVN